MLVFFHTSEPLPLLYKKWDVCVSSTRHLTRQEPFTKHQVRRVAETRKWGVRCIWTDRAGIKEWREGGSGWQQIKLALPPHDYKWVWPPLTPKHIWAFHPFLLHPNLEPWVFLFSRKYYCLLERLNMYITLIFIVICFNHEWNLNKRVYWFFLFCGMADFSPQSPLSEKKYFYTVMCIMSSCKSSTKKKNDSCFSASDWLNKLNKVIKKSRENIQI